MALLQHSYLQSAPGSVVSELLQSINWLLHYFLHQTFCTNKAWKTSGGLNDVLKWSITPLAIAENIYLVCLFVNYIITLLSTSLNKQDKFSKIP